VRGQHAKTAFPCLTRVSTLRGFLAWGKPFISICIGTGAGFLMAGGGSGIMTGAAGCATGAL